MPWTAGDAAKHDRKAGTPKKARQWAAVANSVLKRTGDDGVAVREANGVIARASAKRAEKAKGDREHAAMLAKGSK
jgi:hypothetical protein